jgi:hypothetical protein
MKMEWSEPTFTEALRRLRNLTNSSSRSNFTDDQLECWRDQFMDWLANQAVEDGRLL